MKNMPSIPIYIREANYQKLRRASERTEKTIGQIINELIENSLQNVVEAPHLTQINVTF